MSLLIQNLPDWCKSVCFSRKKIYTVSQFYLESEDNYLYQAIDSKIEFKSLEYKNKLRYLYITTSKKIKPKNSSVGEYLLL